MTVENKPVEKTAPVAEGTPEVVVENAVLKAENPEANTAALTLEAEIKKPTGTEPARVDVPPQTKTEWTPTGNTLVDTIAQGYIAKGGTPEQMAELIHEVGQTGKLLDSHKRALADTFGDLAPALIPSLENAAQANIAWVANERKAVFDVVGGETAFNDMRSWAHENLDQETQDYISAGLEKGGKTAQAAIAQLKTFMKEKGATVTDTTHKANGEQATNTDAPLGLAQYVTEKATLVKAGNTEGIAALEARARVAMNAAHKKGLKWR
jgi:hypothetical protein